MFDVNSLSLFNKIYRGSCSMNYIYMILQYSRNSTLNNGAGGNSSVVMVLLNLMIIKEV